MANAYYDGTNDAGPTSDNADTIGGMMAGPSMFSHPHDGPRPMSEMGPYGNQQSYLSGLGRELGSGETVNEMINGDLTSHRYDGRGGMDTDMDGDCY